MALKLLLLSLFIAVITLSSKTEVQAQGQADYERTSSLVTTEALEWPMPMSLYSDIDKDVDEEIELDEEEGEFGRRSLFWHRTKYYISYGALAANRIPCPPRSGRSYYTNNCFSAQGPAHPYTRGCSRITRCRR